VTNNAHLQWEARWGRPAAATAFGAGVLLLVQLLVVQTVLSDRPGIKALPDSLLSIDEKPGLFLGSAMVQALGVLLVTPVFLYLFRASMARGAGMPGWFVYLVYAGPVVLAAALVLGSIDRIDLAHQFADRAFTAGKDCPAIQGERGADCADDLLRDGSSTIVFALVFAGSIAVAFLYVMLPLRARRVGLLSPFMGILGVVAGALVVLQLPLVAAVVQAFWLGAVGSLYLGNWPGGRGPAWESGEAEPWPTQARRRGLFAPPGGGAPEPEPEPPAEVAAESEPAPERPSSRKRKRKKRR